MHIKDGTPINNPTKIEGPLSKDAYDFDSS